MHQPVGPALSWCRATVLALVALVAGAVAHTSADGLLPGWPVLVLLLGLATVSCRPVLARPASASRVVALAVLAQTGIHVVLTATAGHRGDQAAPVTPLPPVTLGQSHGAADLATSASPPTAGAAPTLSESLHLLAADLPMMLLHLAAAAVVGLWLARGERAVWTLLTLAWRFVAPPVVALPVTPARPVVVRRELPTPRLRTLAPVVTRRGPPALLAA